MLTSPHTTKDTAYSDDHCHPRGSWKPSQLDVGIFASPYILIDRDNKAVATARTLDDALDVLTTTAAAVTIVGTLRPPLLGIDVDTDDEAATSEACLAFTDALIAWCDAYGLPWLRRESGRSGHFHLIVKVPPALQRDFRHVTANQGRWHRVSASVRSTLRLTSAPHRNGASAGEVEGTIGVSDAERAPEHSRRQPRRASARRKTQTLPGRGVRRISRSEGEYGNALAMARAGWSGDRAWKAARQPGSKAAEIGQTAWRRWIWAPAITVVDAERGVSEPLAWVRFQQASPVQARRLGHQRWHDERWLPSRHEATLDRPRRRHINRTRTQVPCRADSDQRRRRLALLRKAFLNSAHDNRGRLSELRRPVRLRSLCAALYALATVIVYHAGSVSVRDWAERARLDPKTVRRARDSAQQLGLIRQVHKYGGGTADCDTWLPAVPIARFTGADDPKSPTRSYTPHAPIHGSAQLHRLRRTHCTERVSWHRYCTMNRPPSSPPVTRPPRHKADTRGGTMLASLPAPPSRESIITWTPRTTGCSTALLVPSLHSPYHSRQAITALLDAVEYLQPDLVIQTGAVLASDEANRHEPLGPSRADAIEMILNDFFAPMFRIYPGTILITNRRARIEAGQSFHNFANALGHTTATPRLTILNPSWAIADNITLSSPYTQIPGNYALTIAQALQVSIVSGSSGHQGRASVTRRGTRKTTLSGIEIGTLIDTSSICSSAEPTLKNGYGILDLRLEQFTLKRLPTRRRGTTGDRTPIQHRPR